MVRLLIVDSVSSVITPVLSGSNLQGVALCPNFLAIQVMRFSSSKLIIKTDFCKL